MADSYEEQLRAEVDVENTYRSGIAPSKSAGAMPWESSGMTDEELLVKFREWIAHAHQCRALHVSIPLPVAEQIFSHFEAWERRGSGR